MLEPVDSARRMFDFEPGDYMQFDIPAYGEIRFSGFDIPEPFATVWQRQYVTELVATNNETGRRNNYSIARYEPQNRAFSRSTSVSQRLLPGQDCPPGVGSSYMFSMKPGDTISAIGPMGDFHIKPTSREMVYIGGGAGMGPLRAHISRLFEEERTARKVSYWYGARSLQEAYYVEYFESLAAQHGNFHFQVALSSPLESDNWTGAVGMIHDVVARQYLDDHPNPAAVEYYLCGPPMMVRCCRRMLDGLGVPDGQVAFDEF